MDELHKIIGEIKSELIDYYDSIKNEIDIKVQTLVYSREKESISSNGSNVNNDSSFLENDEQLLNKIYSEFINLCDEIFNRSMNELNNYLHETTCLSYSDKDEIKQSVLTSFCMFVDSDNLDPGKKSLII